MLRRTLSTIALLSWGCAQTVRAGDGAGDGCARAMDSLRPLRPLSAERAGSPTPLFRWRGAASEVLLCRDRACVDVIARESVTGASWRPSRPLPPGALFWRARAGGAASATRLVVIPERALEFGCLRRLADYDGDGVEERVTASPRELRVRYREGLRADTVLLAAPELAGSASPCVAERRVEAMQLDPAGDIDGDGYPDALLRERSAEIPCGSRDALQRWRFGLIAGGPGGLRGPTRWLPEAGVRHAWESIRLEPVGDIDDDGYEDLALARTSTLLSRCAPVLGGEILYGAPGGCLSARDAEIVAPGGITAACDVNGDGVEELVASDGDSSFGLYRVEGRRLRAHSLPTRCGATALRFFDRCIPGVNRPEADLRPVGDANGDGVGDVVTPLFDGPDAGGPRGRATFYGGVGGFRDDFCAVELP